jgi:ABC-type enterobactin transport system permease subunit
MKKSYVLIQDFKAPYVVATGMAHQPSKIMLKKYVKGQIVEGQIIISKGQPSILLVSGIIPIPVSVLREVVTKEIVQSNASGDGKGVTPNKVIIKKTNTRYLDAGIIGAILGAGAIFLAEKQNIIATPDKKYKLYGAVAGAVLGMYIVYRKK